MIGIIGAMKDEVDILIEELEDEQEIKVASFSFHTGRIEEHDVVLVQCGIGKVNAAIATTILINTFECDLIINTGIAGGCKGTKTKDIIIGEGLLYHDFDLVAFGYDYSVVPNMPKLFTPHPEDLMKVRSVLNKLGLEYKCGLIASGDKFVTSYDTIKEVKDLPLAVEMEGAAIAHTALRLGTRFIILRYISDVIGEESQVENYHEFEEEMANRSSRITLDLIRNL